MAEKSTSSALGLTQGSEEYANYKDAISRLEGLLDQREGKLFDPTMLAMAQGFLAPTKTGSFGESLGNVAAAVGPAVQAENKSAMENAKMRLELAQAGMQGAMDVDRVQNIKNILGDALPTPGTRAAGAPQTPAGAPTGPSVGAAPTALPSGAPTAPATPTAPPAPQAPASTAPAGGLPLGVAADQASMLNLTPDEKKFVALGMYEKKPVTELLKDIDKMRKDSMVYKENYGIHVPSNTIYPFPTSKMEDITFPGEKGVFKANAGDIMRLQHYAQTDDPRYNDVKDRIIYGPKVGRMVPPVQPAAPAAPAAGGAPAPAAGALPSAAPPAPIVAPTGAGRIPTAGDIEAESARKKELAGGEAKNEVERRKTLPDDIKRYDSLARSADSLYEIVDKNPKGFGTFDKPGVLPAIGVLVRDGIRANKVNVDMGGWEDAIRGANPKIKESDINAVRLGAAEQANIELNYANMFLKGTGPITEGERAIVRRAGVGNVSMSPEVLKLRAQAVGKRASYERDDLDAYRRHVLQNPDSSYSAYMETPKYKELYSAYDKEMRGLAGLTSTKQQKGKPDLKAAGANVDKETD